MGALHAGHVSLVEIAKKRCNFVVASIFVNPTQFNNPDDLLKYPRILEKDIELLEQARCDAVFIPEEKEIYPDGRKVQSWDFGTISHVLEAHYRPGHFDGVLTVVKRLFEIVNPQLAFFGEKDFQQLSLIRKMTEQERLGIEIVSCPTVREIHGLAMSSRNLRLTSAERISSLNISKVLYEMKALRNRFLPHALSEYGKEKLSKAGGLKLEYLEIVDAESFEVIADWNAASPIALVAAYAGDVRLIDNMRMT